MVRRLIRNIIAAALLVAGGAAYAQEGAGGLIDPQRDCQTIVNCRFTKGGSYRGCVSSYSCRVCRFVDARCAGSGARVCRTMRCSWG
jgi:hypothetical protein